MSDKTTDVLRAIDDALAWTTARDERAAKLAEALAYAQQDMNFQAIVPDHNEQIEYIEDAHGDLDRAISLAQLAIPHDLARKHPGVPVTDLARLAHCSDPTDARSTT